STRRTGIATSTGTPRRCAKSAASRCGCASAAPTVPTARSRWWRFRGSCPTARWSDSSAPCSTTKCASRPRRSPRASSLLHRLHRRARRGRRLQRGAAPLLELAAKREERLQRDDERGEHHERAADRARHEHRHVAARKEQRAPEVLLHHRAEHVAQQDRRHLEVESDEHPADEAEYQHLPDLEQAVVGAVDAQRDEEKRGREEEAIWHLEQLHPDADERHVEEHEQDVADPEARDEAPEEVRVLGDELRPGLDALD